MTVTLTAPLSIWINELIVATPLAQRMFALSLKRGIWLNLARSERAEWCREIITGSQRLFAGATYTLSGDTREASIEINFPDERAAIEWRLSHDFDKVSFETR